MKDDASSFPITKRVTTIPPSEAHRTVDPLIVFTTFKNGEMVIHGDFRTQHEWGLLPKSYDLSPPELLMALETLNSPLPDQAIGELEKENNVLDPLGYGYYVFTPEEWGCELYRLKVGASDNSKYEGGKVVEKEKRQYLITMYRRFKDGKFDPQHSTYAKVNYLGELILRKGKLVPRLEEFIIPAYRILVENPDGTTNPLSHYTAQGQNEVLETVASNRNALTIPMPERVNRLFDVRSETHKLDVRSKLYLRLFTEDEILTH